MKEGIDYDVSYFNDTGIGDATVTITGIDQYIGTKTVKYEISLPTVEISSLKAIKAGFTVTWMDSLSSVDGCQIRYSKQSSMSGAKTVKVKKGAINPAKTIRNLNSGKKYYVQIRTYKTLNGKNYYSEWSRKESVKTKKK